MINSRDVTEHKRAEADLVGQASALNDVGKLGVPDEILRKPGALTEEDRAIVAEHSVFGARILHGSPSRLLQLGEKVALTTTSAGTARAIRPASP